MSLKDNLYVFLYTSHHVFVVPGLNLMKCYKSKRLMIMLGKQQVVIKVRSLSPVSTVQWRDEGGSGVGVDVPGSESGRPQT